MTRGFPILCVNAGSSSLKFALYRFVGTPGDEETLLAHGAAEQIGLPDTRLWVRRVREAALVEQAGPLPDHRTAMDAVFSVLEAQRLPGPAAVGHRVVHGGPAHVAPKQVDAGLLDHLRQLIPLAPLHLPSEIAGIEAVAARFTDLPQVLCFDTAFHRRMPELAQRLPLPEHLWEAGLRRYGFHGLSYEYIVSVLRPVLPGRLIIAHLGNGASLAALHDGQPIETTMGFTPAGGLMMGTRSGDLDPGVLLYLLDEKGYDAMRLGRLVNQEAGLLGVSGTSRDMKTLLAARAHDPRAALAVRLFCYHVKKHIGALAAVLGGLDTLVFTGGIGERAASVRWEVCQGLSYLGVRLDAGRNDAHADLIGAAGSPCTVRVIPTDEDLMIARHTHALLFQGKAAG